MRSWHKNVQGVWYCEFHEWHFSPNYTSLLPLMYEFPSKETPGKVSISYWNLWFCIIFIIRYEAVSVSRFSSSTPPPPKFRQVAIGALSTVLYLYKIVFTMNWPLQFFQTCKKKSDKNLHLQFESGQKYPTCIPYEMIKFIFCRRQTRKDFIYSIQNLLLSIKVLSIIPVSRSWYPLITLRI